MGVTGVALKPLNKKHRLKDACVSTTEDYEAGAYFLKSGGIITSYAKPILPIECAQGLYMEKRKTSQADIKHLIPTELKVLEEISKSHKLTERDINIMIYNMNQLSTSAEDYVAKPEDYEKMLKDGPLGMYFLKPEEEAQLDEIRNGESEEISGEDKKPTEDNSSRGYLMDHEEIMATTLPQESLNDEGCIHPRF
jgi:hypothetical protein